MRVGSNTHRIHGTGIFTYIWLIFMVNVGKYAIHGWYGIQCCLIVLRLTLPKNKFSEWVYLWESWFWFGKDDAFVQSWGQNETAFSTTKNTPIPMDPSTSLARYFSLAPTLYIPTRAGTKQRILGFYAGELTRPFGGCTLVFYCLKFPL